jgi:maltooligosyltrehalose trehalohydrolase
MQTTTKHNNRTVGAALEGDGVCFRVWALGHEQIELVLYEGGREVASHPLQPEGEGYFAALIPGLEVGTRYKFRVDGEGPFPDPASRYQPEGVHGPSEVVDLEFEWSDGEWRGLPMEELVVYELHVGTATPEGTFEALIPKLEYIRELGATAIEIMPIADFPGERNWGYDGVDLYAPTRAYGGPRGLQGLVDAAHAQGLAVLLDVVYNHLGPDGNYLRAYSEHYFTDRHHTPWGEAINYDGPNAGPVRDFFIGNALYWLREYHIDGLRLDATHEIKDDSEVHVLRELSKRAQSSLPERTIVLIAENENNDAQILTPREAGGWGLNGVWADDFHHQLRSALAGDNEGYYADYTGEAEDIASTVQRGWFYEGQPRLTTEEHWGTPASAIPYPAFVRHIQNHDQIGNRAMGERLNHDIELAAFRAASAFNLLDPATPMLFMGQEWAASSPFLFFTDYGEELGRLVTEGRRAEFKGFSAFADEAMRERIPDPQARETFTRSKLNWQELEREPHAGVLRLYRDVLALRKAHPAARNRERGCTEAIALGPDAVGVRRGSTSGAMLLVILNLRGTLRLDLSQHDLSRGCEWRLRLSSEEAQYGGAGSEAVSLDGTRLTMRGPSTVILEAQW